MKYFTKLTVGFATFSMLASTGTDVLAASTTKTDSNNSSTTANVQNSNAKEDLSLLDPYVNVKNNQFELDLPINSNFSNQIISQTKAQLKAVNDSVKREHAFIDPETKQIEVINDSPFMILASHRTEWGKVYWWGIRVYFKSNAAVYREARSLRNSATITQYLSIASAAIPGIGPISGVGLQIWGKVLSDHNNIVASRLLAYNRSHKRSHIYMNYNFNGQFSFHTFK